GGGRLCLPTRGPRSDGRSLVSKLAVSDIWGTPFSHRSLGAHDFSATESVPLLRELHTFLADEIAHFLPDLIVVVERKGTAVLRALKEDAETPLQWPWEKVLASTAIEQLD